MSSYAQNWEIGVLVTAEAVFGIGHPQDEESSDEPLVGMDEAAD